MREYVSHRSSVAYEAFSRGVLEEEKGEGGKRSELYKELCELLGMVYAERLCAVFGGRRVYISLAGTNQVVRHLGDHLAKRMVELYGRGYMYIPMAGFRGHRRVADAVIVDALKSGQSTNHAVATLGISRHRVEIVRRRYGLRGKAGNPGFCRSKQ